jgi:hypothetical protein
MFDTPDGKSKIDNADAQVLKDMHNFSMTMAVDIQDKVVRLFQHPEEAKSDAGIRLMGDSQTMRTQGTFVQEAVQADLDAMEAADKSLPQIRVTGFQEEPMQIKAFDQATKRVLTANPDGDFPQIELRS